jgi:hypothetical protein
LGETYANFNSPGAIYIKPNSPEVHKTNYVSPSIISILNPVNDPENDGFTIFIISTYYTWEEVKFFYIPKQVIILLFAFISTNGL